MPLMQAWAVPANPKPVTVKQPGRQTIEIVLRGDEHLHWHEDEAGYTILKADKDGPWVYAVLDANGQLAPSQAIVGEANPAVMGLPKRLLPADAIADAMASAMDRRSATDPEAPIVKVPKTGTMKNLVVLVAFSDLGFSYTTNQYDALFNEIGYTTDGGEGSVKDYYHEVSYNQLTVDSVVVAPVTLANGYAYYGGNDASGDDLRPREMVSEALAALEARGFDFSTVDADSDGWVDGLTIIHAGGGEEMSGNDSDYIWSHQWSLTSTRTYDGTSMREYHTEPGRRGWDSSSSSWGVTRIGVICHENGHFLGLPDFYDYDYDSEGVGDFCLMAGGSWNGDNGSQPAQMSAWCKADLNWLTPTSITVSGSYTLPRVEDNKAIFKLSGPFPSSQYFLIENRQGVGFDAGLPGPNRGLLIWHVDETQPDNDDQTHYMLDLEEASGTQHLELNSNTGNDSDYFRIGTMTSFTSNTTPNNKSYANVPVGLEISSISSSASSMTFTVTSGSEAPPTFSANPGPLGATTGVARAFTVSATGNPTPTLALKAQTASSGYSFVPVTGVLTYTPPGADLGSRSFTFTASNTQGVVTQVVSVTVVALPPVAPASIWASATNATDFTAAWSAVSGATSYRLDVATNATFSGGGAGGASRTNDCANIGGGTVSSYLTRTWTNNTDVVWNAYKARIDQTVNGNPSICLKNEAGAYLTGVNIPAGIGNLSFVVQQMFSGTGGQLTVFVNGSQVDTFAYDATVQTAMVANINVSSVTSLVISNNTSARPAINHLVWTDYGASGPAFVPGYSNRTAAGTSESVTGLTAETTYYFRARTVSASGTSTNSATASVATLGVGSAPVMDVIPPQVVGVGTDLFYTVTATEPDVDVVTFACTSIVDEATWDFDTDTGDFLFEPTATEVGSRTFSFTATDKDGTSPSVDMMVTVNSQAPTNAFEEWVEDQGEDPGNGNFDEGADYDGDGMTTEQEYLADTDPANSNNVLKLEGNYVTAGEAGEDTGQIRFSFPASPNRYYQMEYCTDITNQVSVVVTNLGWGTPDGGGEMTITNESLGTWYGVIRALLSEP